MEANFVTVLARFLLNFINIIEPSKSVSSCQLFLFPPGFEPGTLTPRVIMFSYYTMEANFVVLARFLFLLL